MAAPQTIIWSTGRSVANQFFSCGELGSDVATTKIIFKNSAQTNRTLNGLHLFAIGC